MSFIHNPTSPSARGKSDALESPSRSIAQLVTSDVLSKVTPERLLEVLGLKDPEVSIGEGKQAPFSLDELAEGKVFTAVEYEKYLDACRLYCSSDPVHMRLLKRMV